MTSKPLSEVKPNPYQILAFTHTAREGSFAKAAARLGVTQSSVAQHIGNLEKVIGAPLFVRRRDGPELTRTGQELYAVTDGLVTIEQLVKEKIENYSTLDRGHLKIVATAPRPALLIMRQFVARNPGLSLEFVVSNGTDSMRMLRERQVDVGLLAAPRGAEGLYLETVGESRYLAYMRRDHRLASRDRVSLRDMTADSVILPGQGTQTQAVVKRRLREHGIRLDSTVELASFLMVKETVVHGLGVGIALEDSFFPTDHLVGIPIIELPEPCDICLVTHTDKCELRLVRRFIDTALEMKAGASERRRQTG